MSDNQVKSQNLSNEKSLVSYEDRVARNKHKGLVLWFSGLSGSGKSTIAQNVQKKLFDSGRQVYVLDGDNVRKGLNRDLGFSHEDRTENLRRVAEVAKLFADSGFIVIASFISPYEKERKIAKSIVGNFLKVIHIKSSLQCCKNRDPKGLYKSAGEGKIKNFTGVDDIYEEPKNADLVIDTENKSELICVDLLLDYIIVHS